MVNILVVDDSPTYQSMVGELLQRHGYTCSFEDRGESAVATAIKTQPDLILMDVIMPGMSGFQATRQLTKNPQTAHIPVIIVSTKDQATDRMWGLRQGAREYLVKTVSDEDFLATIEHVLKT
jgi:twitching motility two-component system response regulator PilH